MVGTRGPVEASVRPGKPRFVRVLRGLQALGSLVRQRLNRELTTAHGARPAGPGGEVPGGAPMGICEGLLG